MKQKIVLIALLITGCNASCQSQTKNDSTFRGVTKLFPEEQIPSKYKDGVIGDDINKIPKGVAFKYLFFTEEDLKMNDCLYNFDDNIQYDNWVEVLPGALGKISRKNYVALIYALLKSPTIGLETYKTMLTTFTYDGQFVDSMTVRSEYTLEDDWRDVVFLEDDILRIFDYKPNSENFNEKGEIIDENGHLTVVEITDYQITDEGKIIFVQSYPKQYLKEWVTYYRQYHKDSDDPMNDY